MKEFIFKGSVARAPKGAIARRGRPPKKTSNEDRSQLEDLLEHIPTVIEDPWKFHDSEQCCAAKLRCGKPQDENVQWVREVK